MTLSMHELKRLVRRAAARRSACNGCSKRRVLPDFLWCRTCAAARAASLLEGGAK